MRSYRPVNAALRVLDVLKAVNHLEAANVSRIARMTGLSSATVVRMLETLVEGGFVVRSTERPVYYPTERTLVLSAGLARGHSPGAMVRDHREALGHAAMLTAAE